jgi:hypothetical protein
MPERDDYLDRYTSVKSIVREALSIKYRNMRLLKRIFGS